MWKNHLRLRGAAWLVGMVLGLGVWAMGDRAYAAPEPLPNRLYFLLDIAHPPGANWPHQVVYTEFIQSQLSAHGSQTAWAISGFAQQYNPVIPLAVYRHPQPVIAGALHALRPWGLKSNWLAALEQVVATIQADQSRWLAAAHLGDQAPRYAIYLWVAGSQQREAAGDRAAWQARVTRLAMACAQAGIRLHIEVAPALQGSTTAADLGSLWAQWGAAWDAHTPCIPAGSASEAPVWPAPGVCWEVIPNRGDVMVSATGSLWVLVDPLHQVHVLHQPHTQLPQGVGSVTWEQIGGHQVLGLGSPRAGIWRLYGQRPGEPFNWGYTGAFPPVDQPGPWAASIQPGTPQQGQPPEAGNAPPWAPVPAWKTPDSSGRGTP